MERPSRYRRKPVIVEAMRYTRESRDALIKWCGAQSTAIGESGERYELENLTLHTSRGPIMVRLNDWVIKDVNEGFCSCPPALFEATHDFIENNK